MFGIAPIGALPHGGAAPYVAPVVGRGEIYLLLSPRDSDQATLVASSQQAGLGPANLQTRQPQKKWRGAGTVESITGVLAAPIAANALALVGHNLGPSAVLRLRFGFTAANLTTTPEIVDTGWVSAWPVTGKPQDPDWPNWLTLLRWSASTAGAYFRLDIADPDNLDGYVEAGRLAFGVAWQPQTNFDLGGIPLGFVPPDVQATTPWGYTFTDRRASSAPRAISLIVTGADGREVKDGIASIQRLAGLWQDVIVCLDPAETTDFHLFSMQGVFVPKPQFPIVPQFTDSGVMYGATLQLNELL